MIKLAPSATSNAPHHSATELATRCGGAQRGGERVHPPLVVRQTSDAPLTIERTRHDRRPGEVRVAVAQYRRARPSRAARERADDGVEPFGVEERASASS